MNQNTFIFVQENGLTNYSKERGNKISVTPLYTKKCSIPDVEVDFVEVLGRFVREVLGRFVERLVGKTGLLEEVSGAASGGCLR
jgi:hypothetical protein